ncbi:MAG TPA: S24 family peptidase [Acidobacteriaceae bacterium]|nr:S24 family peptidase [Acidobacteriaceae bacterium]
MPGLERNELTLPAGCFVNYDLAIIDFLKSLVGDDLASDYEALKASLGQRPTFAELYRAGISIDRLRKQYGQWWAFVREQGDLADNEARCLEAHGEFLREVETTPMTKSFKMIVLEALLDNGGFRQPPLLSVLAEQSRSVLRRRPVLQADLASNVRDLDSTSVDAWQRYWRKNPIRAWLGENLSSSAKTWFTLDGDQFKPTFPINAEELEPFDEMVRQILDQRLAVYQLRNGAAHDENELPQAANVIPIRDSDSAGTALPFFPNLRVACGHFRSGRADAEEYRTLGSGHGRLDAGRHFIARASGNSMNGGKNPVRDGDYLLLERIDPNRAGSITGSAVVIERQDASGDDQYLLRVVTKTTDGRYVLKAANPDYGDIEADESMRTLARLRAVLDPLEVSVGSAPVCA